MRKRQENWVLDVALRSTGRTDKTIIVRDGEREREGEEERESFEVGTHVAYIKDGLQTRYDIHRRVQSR